MAVLLGLISSIVLSKHYVDIHREVLSSSNIEYSLRIIHLSDLHNATFGSSNSRLITKIESEDPDLILMTGDMVNNDNQNISVITDLIRRLKEIAPIYYSYGNHEKAYIEKFDNQDDTSLKESLETAGATVLECDWIDTTVNGTDIRIGGIYGYCLPRKYTAEGNKEEQEFLTSFEDTDSYKILLSHMPYTWRVLSGLDDWDIDLVLSGHNHGGQIIIPGIGGLYAPDMGWFPGRVWGKFTSKTTGNTLIISRGLGNENWLPRINNLPEIGVIEISSEEQ